MNEEENQAKIYLEKGGFGIIDYGKVFSIALAVFIIYFI